MFSRSAGTEQADTSTGVTHDIDKLGFQPVGSTPAEFADQIKNDIVVWSKVMKDANIPVN
jgi:tripartite-type tricarboxylate transporter receptor subunit TctC